MQNHIGVVVDQVDFKIVLREFYFWKTLRMSHIEDDICGILITSSGELNAFGDGKIC